VVPHLVDDLVKDHLFQQNAIIWLTQPSVRHDGMTPILFGQGYSMLAIGRLLTLPVDLRQAIAEAQIAVQQKAKPDVILTHKEDRKYLFVECKENSFGPSSTTAKQARALMLMTGTRAAEILGLDASEVAASYLGYVLPEAKVALLAETLDCLREEMADVELPYGPSSALGLAVRDGQVYLLVQEPVSSFVGLSSGAHPFMAHEPGTDPRPFYFLPYDPGIEQIPQERDRCIFDLLKRLQQYVVAEVGQARPPAELELVADSLLTRAYFGMYELWEDRDDRRPLRRLCNRFLNKIARTLHSTVPESMVQEGNLWKVTIQDEGRHAQLMSVLTRFGPEATDLLEHMPQLPESYDDA